MKEDERCGLAREAYRSMMTPPTWRRARSQAALNEAIRSCLITRVGCGGGGEDVVADQG